MAVIVGVSSVPPGLAHGVTCYPALKVTQSAGLLSHRPAGTECSADVSVPQKSAETECGGQQQDGAEHGYQRPARGDTKTARHFSAAHYPQNWERQI